MTKSDSAESSEHPTGGRPRARLLLVSFLILFLELACIRWFPAHVLFLTFFTNVVLLACFLGMSVGCLAARSRRCFVSFTPALLVLAVVSALAVEGWANRGGRSRLEVGDQSSPQVVFFGTEHVSRDPAAFIVPIECVAGLFFALIALAFVGLGQELGRALASVPDRVTAYTINIAGSLVGILAFAGCSLLELPPFWWFLPAAVCIAPFLVRGASRPVVVLRALPLVALPMLAGIRSGSTDILVADPVHDSVQVELEHRWSPYYRIDYFRPPMRSIMVNQIGHQEMSGRDETVFAYALPHVLNRDSGGPAFENVLVIGAGSGNDVSRALQWGAKHVDAVEIDPVIQRLGAADHPDHPYDDPRVTVHLDDGRNFLRSTTTKYDLVVYALVDSLVLHSSYSNIRLESYLFTEEAFRDVRRCLKPDGMFAMYNLYRQGWIVSRLRAGVTDAFGSEPLVFSLPYRETIGEEDALGGSFTFLLAGDVGHVERAFADGGEFWMRREPPSPDSPNGFALVPPETEEAGAWQRFGPTTVVATETPVAATDDWPFLYLREPMIPRLAVRGILLVAGLSTVLVLLFLPRSVDESREHPLVLVRMFALGAGFMLVETRAVVHMALLFGSTWMVNSVIFFAILVMILLANLLVIWLRPKRVWPYHVGLLATLLLNALVPLDSFLGLPPALRVPLSCGLVFSPILFAGVVFAVSFRETKAPDRAFGANIAGAMVGGLAENASMLLGFQQLVFVATAFYLLSLVRPRHGLGTESADEPTDATSSTPGLVSGSPERQPRRLPVD